MPRYEILEEVGGGGGGGVLQSSLAVLGPPQPQYCVCCRPGRQPWQPSALLVTRGAGGDRQAARDGQQDSTELPVLLHYSKDYSITYDGGLAWLEIFPLKYSV